MNKLTMLPWHLKLGEEKHDAALFSVENASAVCDMERGGHDADCHPAPFVIGTNDTREPKFCLKHYFEGCDGDGVTNYQLVSDFYA